MKPIHLVLSAPFEKLRPGESRFWGNPDLPVGFDYPMYVDDEGDDYPYFFICQINMEEIAPYDNDNLLPKTGLLSFFAKIDHYMGCFADTDCISGYISDAEDLKVVYFPVLENLRETVLLDDDDNPVAPDEMQIDFSLKEQPLSEEHMMFAPPSHREWESWDHPFEDWQILLQIDSFVGKDFNLNFMDCGVLDFLIHPDDLANLNFENVRAIVLST